MTKGFVPLSASSPPPAAQPAKPKTAAAPAPVALRPLAAGVAPAGAGHAGEPKVTVERDGERVTRIKVQCPCGHIIELACNY